jgi:uncharacterized protein
MRDKTLRGHRLAVRCASSILRQEATALHRIAEHNVQRAFELFRVYRDHLFSFVDCASFAVMEELRVNHAFAFDGNFDEYPGIVRVPR